MTEHEKDPESTHEKPIETYDGDPPDWVKNWNHEHHPEWYEKGGEAGPKPEPKIIDGDHDDDRPIAD